MTKLPTKIIPPSSMRLLLVLAMVFAFGLVMLLFLFITEALLNIWHLLKDVPGWFIFLYFSLLIGMACFGAYVIWRVSTAGRRRKKRVANKAMPSPPDEGQLRSRLDVAEEAGIEVQEARHELEELERRRANREVYIALLGSISAGKSSLIRALVPQAEVEIDPRGGTTQEVSHYHWTGKEGEQLTLTDLPGLHEAIINRDPVAREEAQRAHLVIYVCDGDLTRDQYLELAAVHALSKPVILALNKMDRFHAEDLQAIRQRLKEHVQEVGAIEVVAISAGGQREVVLVHPDGQEERVLRDIPPRVEELAETLQHKLARMGNELDEIRDRNIFALTHTKLEGAVHLHRRNQAEAIIKKYTRRAIIGALAAVTPGSDILIQGYLGFNLVKELSILYEVPTQDVSIRNFISVAGKHVGKTLPMLLAISGNVLKAFPGIGTVTGSLIHAVAYGMIFESLGKSVAVTLDQCGELQPSKALDLFEEDLSENLEVRAREYLKLALETRRERKREPESPS